jgi:hypothetical protein
MGWDFGLLAILGNRRGRAAEVSGCRGLQYDLPCSACRHSLIARWVHVRSEMPISSSGKFGATGVAARPYPSLRCCQSLLKIGRLPGIDLIRAEDPLGDEITPYADKLQRAGLESISDTSSTIWLLARP